MHSNFTQGKTITAYKLTPSRVSSICVQWIEELFTCMNARRHHKGSVQVMVMCAVGAAGCFLGAQHQYLAILANDGATVSVYDLARIGPSPTAALVLDASSTGAVNLFPGPDPLPQPTYAGFLLFLLAACCFVFLVCAVIGCFDVVAACRPMLQCWMLVMLPHPGSAHAFVMHVWSCCV